VLLKHGFQLKIHHKAFWWSGSTRTLPDSLAGFRGRTRRGKEGREEKGSKSRAGRGGETMEGMGHH